MQLVQPDLLVPQELLEQVLPVPLAQLDLLVQQALQELLSQLAQPPL